MQVLRKGIVCLTLILAVMPSPSARAQVGRAQIVGVVRDLSGGVLPGAALEAIDERTGETRGVLANEQGYYVMPALQPSTYTVKASAPAFSVAESKGVKVLAGESVTFNFNLSPAGSSESITVVATQERAIDTSSARIGVNVNEREVHSLPINGRQLSQLYLQAPGSINSGSGTFADVRFSGRAVEQNAIRYDGIEGTAIIDASPGNLNGEIPSPFRLQTSLENVQEFRVESNSFPAEQGSGTGGQVSLVTKSGGNAFHGSLFEYLRNDKFDAANYFDAVRSINGTAVQTLPKSLLRQNQ